jgi:hypothetical protein
MRNFWRKILSTCAFSAFAAVSAWASFTPAAPGRLEPQGLRWKEGVIRLAVSNSLLEPEGNIKAGSDVRGAIARSIAAWQTAGGVRLEFEFTDKTGVSPSGAAGDGVSLISIATTPENVLLFSKDPYAESAKTRVFYNGRNSITEADIILNPFQRFSTDGTFDTFDLEATLTHEIGHLLGLKHSSVLGAAMSDSLPKNGPLLLGTTFGRSLADSDVASIRDLYGFSPDGEECCSAVTGKLVFGPAKPVKGSTVWAEESQSGRVAAISSVNADGSFRLGGLVPGSYTVFWQREGEQGFAPVSFLGAYRLAKGETHQVAERANPGKIGVLLSYIGLNSQLANSAVTLSAGKQYTLYLGGRNLRPGEVEIEFNSPYLSVSPGTVAEQDFGADVSAVNFVVSIHADAPAGVYSVFATTRDGSMASLIGALNVQQP